ncbi:MAG: holin family protein [Pseudomonadota bacterium]
MGLVDTLFGFVFGSGRNAVRETVEVFRENAEQGARRDQELQLASLAQFATEFQAPRKSWFDSFIDALNRVPRPAMALGTLALFVAAMTDPVWFASRMQGIALVPEPLWWLLGAIVSFYFGARHQLKGQEFQKSLAETLARMPAAVEAVKDSAGDAAPSDAAAPIPAPTPGEFPDNAALRAWRQAS